MYVLILRRHQRNERLLGYVCNLVRIAAAEQTYAHINAVQVKSYEKRVHTHISQKIVRMRERERERERAEYTLCWTSSI